MSLQILSYTLGFCDWVQILWEGHKIWKISHLLLKLHSNVKTKWEFLWPSQSILTLHENLLFVNKREVITILKRILARKNPITTGFFNNSYQNSGRKNSWLDLLIELLLFWCEFHKAAKILCLLVYDGHVSQLMWILALIFQILEALKEKICYINYHLP